MMLRVAARPAGRRAAAARRQARTVFDANDSLGENQKLFWRKTPRVMKKTAVQWYSAMERENDRLASQVNNSRWRERFVKQHLYSEQISATNWGEQRHDLEPDEPCYGQKKLGHPGWHMADKIWPISMLQTSCVYISIFVSKVDFVVIPGSRQHDVACEIRDQVLVPLSFWNPKTKVRPYLLQGVPVAVPDDVRPYWVLTLVDGSEHVLMLDDSITDKFAAVDQLQKEVLRLDTFDRSKWLPKVSSIPDQNLWIRVKRHELDEYTINEHCPVRYL